MHGLSDVVSNDRLETFNEGGADNGISDVRGGERGRCDYLSFLKLSQREGVMTVPRIHGYVRGLVSR